MTRRHLIADPAAAVVVGLALFLLGSLVLHDAYEGRGRKPPLILRPLTWW